MDNQEVVPHAIPSELISKIAFECEDLGVEIDFYEAEDAVVQELRKNVGIPIGTFLILDDDDEPLTLEATAVVLKVFHRNGVWITFFPSEERDGKIRKLAFCCKM